MEEEINKLQKNLEEKNGQLQFSALNSGKVNSHEFSLLEIFCFFLCIFLV